MLTDELSKQELAVGMTRTTLLVFVFCYREEE